MAQKNRANMLTDIVSNIYNNLINFITGQNAQDRFVNLLDSSPNILSDASQPNGYVSTDANNEMFSSYYDEEISRADLITDLTANLAVGGKFYRINDAVGSTITLLVIAESNLNLYPIGTDIATGEQGTYDITTDVFTPIVVSGTPNLQQVTDIGFITTNKLVSDDGAGNYTEISNGEIQIATSNTGDVIIDASLVTASYNAQLPDKPTSPQTFAMLSDITSGVASVNSGINISVDNTDPANPIINSLADRYKTSSVTSNTISNGTKTFTVDADLAYIPLQEVLIVYDPSNHMHATVTSYSGTTLVVDVKSHTGGGTYATWVINLDGVPIDAITGVGTANEIAYFTSGQVIASLAVATYPSLTELARVKGVGSQVVGTTDTNTLTNKRITARSGTVASSATPTINTDNIDYYSITALAAAITSFTTNLSGTPTIGQTLWISITDNGTARAITWGASFEASTIALPTTTVISTRLDVAFIWNEATSKWRCVGTA